MNLLRFLITVTFLVTTDKSILSLSTLSYYKSNKISHLRSRYGIESIIRIHSSKPKLLYFPGRRCLNQSRHIASTEYNKWIFCETEGNLSLQWHAISFENRTSLLSWWLIFNGNTVNDERISYYYCQKLMSSDDFRNWIPVKQLNDE